MNLLFVVSFTYTEMGGRIHTGRGIHESTHCIMCHNPKSEAIVKKSKDLAVKEKANFPFTY